MGTALIALGLVFGPAYYIYARFFSGVLVASFRFDMEESPSLSKPKSAKASLLRVSEPVAVPLNPQMDPVRLTLKLRGHWDTRLVGPVRNRYRARLAHGDALISERVFEVAAAGPDPGSQVYRKVLATLRVPREGDYVFLLEEIAEPEMVASDFQLEVRSNIQYPEMRIVMAGLIMFLSGVIALSL
jgi:hypothetical protein